MEADESLFKETMLLKKLRAIEAIETNCFYATTQILKKNVESFCKKRGSSSKMRYAKGMQKGNGSWSS